MPATATDILTRNPKAALAATLVSVFLCGAIAGALAMNYADPHHSLFFSGYAKKVELEKWRRDLNLSDDQTRQLEMILDDFSKYYDNVLSDGRTRVLQLLNERQKRQFEEMMRSKPPG